jgi:CheY-like chemotaxis protein
MSTRSAAAETVLLVDDESAVRTVIAVMLRRAGYDVIEASSGDGAARLFQRHAGAIRFVVSDIAMPGMQGPELAQRLIALQLDLYVLLISGYVKCSPSTFRLDDRNVAFLAKPFVPAELIAKLRELVTRSAGPAISLTARDSNLANSRTVLVVDDDLATVELYTRMLRPEGFTVIPTTTGEEGLRQFAQQPADVILLDLRMPDIDGLEFLRLLRRSATRRPAVAMITGDYFLDDSIIAQVRALGAELHFKPLWVDDIVGIVRGLLSGATNRATL